MAGNEEAYLRAILATVARQTFPPDRLLELIAPRASEKMIAAYNACDGTMSQSQIVNSVGVDAADLSKAISRWVDCGVVIRTGKGAEARPVHVYPLPAQRSVKKKEGSL